MINFSFSLIILSFSVDTRSFSFVIKGQGIYDSFVCVWETIGHSISLQLLLRIENVQSYQDSLTFLTLSL